MTILHEHSVIELQESISGALAVNGKIEENVTVNQVLSFKGNISALLVERVSVLLDCAGAKYLFPEDQC